MQIHITHIVYDLHAKSLKSIILCRYKPGDTIDVECISRGGYPPPNITWFINGEKVNTLHEIKRDIHKVEI